MTPHSYDDSVGVSGGPLFASNVTNLGGLAVRDLYSKIALTTIAIALASIALRPSDGADALAANPQNIAFLNDPGFERAVAFVVNNDCEVAKLPKSNPRHDLVVTCTFGK